MYKVCRLEMLVGDSWIVGELIICMSTESSQEKNHKHKHIKIVKYEFIWEVRYNIAEIIANLFKNAILK